MLFSREAGQRDIRTWQGYQLEGSGEEKSLNKKITNTVQFVQGMKMH